MHFSVAVVLFDMEMQSIMNFGGQSHLVTLAKGHLSDICQYFCKDFFMKQLRLFQFYFIYN